MTCVSETELSVSSRLLCLLLPFIHSSFRSVSFPVFLTNIQESACGFNMPTITDVLTANLLPVLRPWAISGGMDGATNKRKGDIIQWLVANPSSIPQHILDMCNPILPLPINPVLPPAHPIPPPQVDRDSLITAIRDTVRDEINTVRTEVGSLTVEFGLLANRLEVVESRPGGGSIAPTLRPEGEILNEVLGPPSSFPIPSSLVDAAEQTRAFCPMVPTLVLEAVLSNKLEVKDFWKLDPSRSDDASASTASSASVLASLPSALLPDAERNFAQVKSKYNDLGSILRPWLVYCQLRDIITPNTGRYLVGHAAELLRLSSVPNSNHSAVLHYHLKVASSRLNMHDRLDLNTWILPDAINLSAYFNPYVSAGTASQQKAQPQQAKQPQQWSAHSQGSLTSTLPCHKWNAKQTCASNPCRFKHVCGDCGAGHPKLSCSRPITIR